MSSFGLLGSVFHEIVIDRGGDATFEQFCATCGGE